MGTARTLAPDLDCGFGSTLRSVRSRAYIDGFNLYYGAVRDVPGRRWLDLWRFCERLSPAGVALEHVHYFTTRVSARPNDPDAPTRQDTFLRALATLDGVTVHEGVFKSNVKRSRLVDPQPTRRRGTRPRGPNVPLAELGWPSHAWTYNTEEKASDVNLATQLVLDCCDEGRPDVAMVVSDDTDLAMPVAIARERGLRVLIVSPRGYWLRELAPNEADARKIHLGVPEKCQLPDPITLQDGTKIRKPAGW